jgi:hypothetical protein
MTAVASAKGCSGSAGGKPESLKMNQGPNEGTGHYRLRGAYARRLEITTAQE